MSHEIIAIKRPVRPKQPIESDSTQENQPKQTESRLEKPSSAKSSSLTTENTSQPHKLEKPRKPGKPKLKKSIQQVTNAQGKVFNSGDKILVSAPWSSMVEAVITGFYQAPEGSTWAIFLPQKSLPNWNWEKGCIRTELLKKP